MAVTQYIGSRYVPVFADPVEWSSDKEYEPLTIVTHEGNSYTSRQFVPKGIDITNESYWALTGNYNAQVEQYRRETAAAAESANAAQTDINTLLPKNAFSESNTVKDYIDDSITSLNDDLKAEITRVTETPMFCISNYNNPDNTGALAFSYDGTSWCELRESVSDFTTLNTDSACYEYNNGFLVLETGSVVGTKDFTALYTKDFETFSIIKPYIGFIDKSYELMGSNAYVWTPSLFTDPRTGYDYIFASIGYADDTAGDPYYISNTKYLNIYGIRVVIDTDNFSITPIGDLFKVKLPHTSQMDACIIYKNGLYVCAYKDRTYNLINIAASTSLTADFHDVQTVVGNTVMSEAPWLIEINNSLYLYYCIYSAPIACNIRVKISDDLASYSDREYVYLSNTRESPSSTSRYKMRNPYPFIPSKQLAQRIFNKYGTPTVVVNNEIAPVLQRDVSTASSFYNIASQVVYEQYGKYLYVVPKTLMKPSTRSEYDKFYILNAGVITNITKAIQIFTPTSDLEIPDINQFEPMTVEITDSHEIIPSVHNKGISIKQYENSYGLTITQYVFNNIGIIRISGNTSQQIENGTTLCQVDVHPVFGNFSVPYISATTQTNGMFSVTGSGNLNWYGTRFPSGGSCIVCVMFAV